MEHKNYNAIHKSVRKKDSMQLLLGNRCIQMISRVLRLS